MKFDDILKDIGSAGRFQVVTFIVLAIPILAGPLFTFAQTFIAISRDHWCSNSQWATDDCSKWNLTYVECESAKRSIITPPENSQCSKYNVTGLDFETAFESPEDLSNLTVTECDEGWDFGKGDYESSIIIDWQLVCDNSAIPNLLQSVYFGGFLFGSLMVGTLGDRIGRYYTLCICIVGSAVIGVLCAISLNAIMYLILRFFAAAFSLGCGLMIFLIVTEIVSPPDRVYVGVAIWYFYALGYFVLAGMAYFIQNWRILMVAVTVLYIVMIPVMPFISESPRWLLNQKKYDAAEKVIRKMAKVNRKTLSDNFMQVLAEQEETTEKSKKATILDIVRSPILLMYTLNLWFNWFVQSFVYYGLSLGTSTLGVNVYIAFCISGAVEIPAYTLCIYALNTFGRRMSSFFWNVFAGISCFCTIFIAPGYARVAVAMLGKFAITISFANIYVHTSEVFPTPLRSLGLGTCSIAARVGGIIAPMILYFGEISPSLPLITFALSAVLAGVLVLLLPETKGKLMPDTIEDAINLKYAAERKTKEGDNTATFQMLATT